MRNDTWARAAFDRRQFLQRAVTGAAFGVAAQSGIWLASSDNLYAQTNLTPDAALQELLAGNQRFAANQLTSIEHDLRILKERTVDKQEPFAAVLS
jgi:carbonic anhydrase